MTPERTLTYKLKSQSLDGVSRGNFRSAIITANRVFRWGLRPHRAGMPQATARGADVQPVQLASRLAESLALAPSIRREVKDVLRGLLGRLGRVGELEFGEMPPELADAPAADASEEEGHDNQGDETEIKACAQSEVGKCGRGRHAVWSRGSSGDKRKSRISLRAVPGNTGSSLLPKGKQTH